MAININREVEDTFYRYKMPRLQAKVEGKGNGIKTVIVNVTDIARALYRKPIYVTKYFGCELGAQVNVDEKNERYIVNGAHDAEKLQQLLDGFIKKFVLCPNCQNPETDLSVKKKSEIVKATCKACGAVKNLDPQHRLTQYIMKNPPDETEYKRPNKTATTKKGSGDEGVEEVVPVVDDREIDDNDWGEDATEEAARQRLEELSARVKSLAMSTDVEKTKSERAQIFFTLVSRLHQSGELIKKRVEVLDEADRLDLGSRGVLVLTEVLLNDPETVLKVFSDHAVLYRDLIRDSGDAEKSQMNLLNGLVTLVNQYPDMVKRVAHLVKSMYDKDVCTEEVILKWADKAPTSKFGPKKVHEQVLAKCKVFTDWLREAEEDSDEEEDEEEEDEQSKKAVVKTAEPPRATEPTQRPAQDDDDDFDIDAI